MQYVNCEHINITHEEQGRISRIFPLSYFLVSECLLLLHVNKCESLAAKHSVGSPASDLRV